jgi:hypothetical protein
MSVPSLIRDCTALLLLPLAGCSLILDFSDEAIPVDALPDAPYSAAECQYAEPNDTIDTAVMITSADTGPAAICAGSVEDRDFYRITVPAMTRVEIRLEATFRPGGDLDLRFHDNDGLPQFSMGFVDQERITCPGPGQPTACPTLPAGDYVFEVFPASGSVNRYTFAVTLTAL